MGDAMIDFQRVCEAALVNGVMSAPDLEGVILLVAAATRIGVPIEDVAEAINATVRALRATRDDDATGARDG